MANKRFYWLKLKEDYLDNPKIKKLRKIAGGDTYTIIYLKMQLLSIKNGGIIEFEGIEKTIDEELSLILDEQLEDIQLTLSYLNSQKLIEINENKDIFFIEASENIGSEGSSAERVRIFREKQKMLQCNTPVTLMKQNSISNSISKSKSNNIYNTSNNIYSDNIEGGKNSTKDITITKTITKERFKKPTVEEVKEYCLERKNNVNAESFVDFYESKGWKIGKNSMKDWKACVRTWERSSNNNASGKKEVKARIQTREYDKEKLSGLYDSLEDVEI